MIPLMVYVHLLFFVRVGNENYVTVYGVITQLSMSSMAIYDGVGQAAQPILAAATGAKLLERIRQAFRHGVRLELIGTLALHRLPPRPLRRLLHGGPDPRAQPRLCRGSPPVGERFSAADLARQEQEARDAQARERTQYTFLEQTPQQAQAEANAPFHPNRGQAHNNITKHNSTAIKEVFGEQVYDEIDAMQQGSVQDRTVKLHHSLGTKWQKEGADVLEMEFAGSGAEDVIKHNRNRGRFLRAHLTPEQEDKIYGEKVKKGKSSTFQYIRRKELQLEARQNAAGLLEEMPQEKYNSALDDKIAAQRQRMAQKPGYLEQKLRQTQERLNKEKDIRARLQKPSSSAGTSWTRFPRPGWASPPATPSKSITRL